VGARECSERGPSPAMGFQYSEEVSHLFSVRPETVVQIESVRVEKDRAIAGPVFL